MILPIADNWFETRRYSDDITLIYEPHVIPDIHCNMWHVRGRDHDLLFDTGMGVMSLKNHVALVTEKPLLCVASHSHFDHVGGHHEFDNRIMHAAEADIMTVPTRDNTVISDYVSADIFTAAPFADFDPDAYTITAAPPTRLVADGDVIDLGDRQFEVLHLPGHSPGGIALWESATATLFSGDVVYDGLLYDSLYHSVLEDYAASMERLRGYKVETVHGGHWESFGQARFVELIDEYLAGARKPGCPID